MNVGTKSILFGVHQFAFHPITVLLAWINLYGWPNWKEFVCIIIHDWGYWGCPNMDGDKGERHPEFASRIAMRLFGNEYRKLCLFHSRHYARRENEEPSKLCWADKFCTIYDPSWFYLFRARLSGELAEYRLLAHNGGFVSLDKSDQEWMDWIKDRFIKLAKEKRGDAVEYVNPRR